MNLQNFDISWKQIKGEFKTHWVKLANRDSGVITGIGDKPSKDPNDPHGPTDDDIKEQNMDSEKH